MSTPPPAFPPPEPAAWASPRARWSTGRRWALGVGIAAASAGLVAGLIAGVTAVATVVADAVDDLGVLPDEALPLVDGPRADPTPAEPAACEDPCFGVTAIDEARLDPAIYSDAGLGLLYAGSGSEPQSQPTAEYDLAANGWELGDGTPDACFVTYPDVPIAYEIDAPPPSGTDSIHFIAARASADEFSTSAHTLRLFGTSAGALDHMQQLQRLIDECREYRLGSDWNAVVSPAPALTLPDSVAAVGWIEVDTLGWRYYSYDLMRANAVVRLTLSTDNGIGEREFRTLVKRAADDMAQWPLDAD